MLGFKHGMHAPADGVTGKLLGSRLHMPVLFEKEIDRSSPMLYLALARGQTLKSAEIKWYRVDDSGREVEYFNMMLGNVKVVSVIPKVSNIKEDAALAYNHVEQVKLRYEEITWSYLDGNLQYANHRRACCGKQKDSKHSLPLFMSPR